MPEHRDHLSNEVSITAKLKDKGIKAGAKSRFVAATDRLLGALLDVPSAWLEKKAAEIRKPRVRMH